MSATINFSGGRTSGMLLKGMLEEGLPENTHVIFCNTGKEHEGTLEFVDRCSKEWGVEIVWLEYTKERPKFKRVSFETASRKGEPFEAVIASKQFLPNVAMRFCTQQMKLKTEYRYCRSLGWDEWDSYVGIRADEPKRIANIRARNGAEGERMEKIMPLADLGIVEADVLEFWRTNHFDLQVPKGFGNCDMCFLKGRDLLSQNAHADPAKLAWWVAQEEKRKATFVKGGVKYADLLNVPLVGTEPIKECGCTD